MALIAGDFGLTHDWIINGCGEDLAHAVERPFRHDRMAEFMASDIPWIKGNRGSTLTDWSYAFYYYCRTRAILSDLAVIVLPSAFQAIDELTPFEEPGDRMSMYDCQLADRLRPSRGSNFRGCIGDDVRCSRRPVSRREFGLRCCLRQSLRATRMVRQKNGRHGRLNMAVRCLALTSRFSSSGFRSIPSEEWERLRMEVFAAAAYYAFSLRHLGSPTAIVLATDQRSSLLNPAVMQLVQFERGADLLAMFAEWYDVPHDRRLTGSPLFVRFPGTRAASHT